MPGAGAHHGSSRLRELPSSPRLLEFSNTNGPFCVVVPSPPPLFPDAAFQDPPWRPETADNTHCAVPSAHVAAGQFSV